MNDDDFNLTPHFGWAALLLPHGDAAGEAFPAEEGLLVLAWDSEKTPGSKYSSTSGLSPRGHLERQAEFHASTQDEA